jgi:hypothetical protein
MKDMLYEAANVLSSATRDQMTRTAKQNWPVLHSLGDGGSVHPALAAAIVRLMAAFIFILTIPITAL